MCVADLSESNPSLVTQSAGRPAGRSGWNIAKRPACIWFFRAMTEDQLYVMWRQCLKKNAAIGASMGLDLLPDTPQLRRNWANNLNEGRQNWPWVFGCLYSASRKKRVFHFFTPHHQNTRLEIISIVFLCHTSTQRPKKYFCAKEIMKDIVPLHPCTHKSSAYAPHENSVVSSLPFAVQMWRSALMNTKCTVLDWVQTRRVNVPYFRPVSCHDTLQFGTKGKLRISMNCTQVTQYGRRWNTSVVSKQSVVSDGRFN